MASGPNPEVYFDRMVQRGSMSEPRNQRISSEVTNQETELSLASAVKRSKRQSLPVVNCCFLSWKVIFIYIYI